MIPLFDWPVQRPKCFKNYVTKNPELFQDILNLAELPLVWYALWSKSSMITTTSRLWDPVLITKILLLTKVTLKSFQKKMKILHYSMPSFSHTFFALVMIYYTLPYFSWQKLHQRQEFPALPFIPHVLGQKVKFTIHLSLFTITIHLSLFIRYCSWHCSLRIFSYLRGLSLIFEASFSRA